MPSPRNLLAACTPVMLVTYEERAGSVGRLPWSATLAASSGRGAGHTTGGSDERQGEDPVSERKNPLDKIDKACRAEEPFYGDGWDIDFERPKPDLFEMNVRRCFWHDFFGRHDARLVTTVMCSWDTNWMRAIDPAVSGLRAERTSLLSLGDDQCRFAVLETDDPLAGYSDKIEQRFTSQQESG
jgi:L-2-amino-thiazoline-4-carboxylic acid hydrolase